MLEIVLPFDGDFEAVFFLIPNGFSFVVDCVGGKVYFFLLGLSGAFRSLTEGLKRLEEALMGFLQLV